MSIPNVSTLFERIHKGSEGGLEFARIINLLLIAESTRQQFKFINFSDASGDYKGVDSIIIQNEEQIGLQYKFFPVPFSPDHKRLIQLSLQTAKQRFPEITKWILITPHDPNRHSMLWLEQLSQNYEIAFEHWGHLRIVDLMWKHPHIGQEYYSEIKNTAPSEELSDNDIRSYFSQFVNSNKDASALFLKAQPNLADCKEVFTPDYYKEVSDMYYIMYRDLMEYGKEAMGIRNRNSVRFSRYSLTDIRNASNVLPGGMDDLFQRYNALHPGVDYYKIEFLEDGAEYGMTYFIWCYLNGRWVFFPKPWRVMRSLEAMNHDKELKRFVRILKFFGFHKFLNKKHRAWPILAINHIAHQLTKEK